MSDSTDEVNAYTVRLELVDRPGELLRALEPIAENGGNLLSIFHERGNLTPRGHVPVEVDLEAPPEQFERIVDALREEGLTVVLVGHLVSTDLSDTIERVQRSADATVTDLSLSAPEGDEGESSARLRLATQAGEGERALSALREIGAEKDLRVIEPLAAGAGTGAGDGA